MFVTICYDQGYGIHAIQLKDSAKDRKDFPGKGKMY